MVAKYAGARPDAPKLISLDEAFAGVDETNIRDMFRLMVEFEFNFMINSDFMGRLRYSSGACNLSVDPSGKCKVRIGDPLYLEWKSKGNAYRRGIVKVEEKLMQECLQYFRERPVYEKVFQKMRGKYESLGHIGGKVVLTGLSLQDKSQLGGFLQKDYTENQSVTISASFEIGRSKADFRIFLWQELPNAYFGKKLR